MLKRILIVCCIALAAPGCDQLRERLAAAISPKSPVEVLASINDKLAKSQFKEAKAEAEPFAQKAGEKQGEFALAVAKACASLSEVDLAIQNLRIAISAQTITAQAAMVDPAFVSIRTDTRFVSMVAGVMQSPVGDAVSVDAGGSTSIKMNSAGTEVKAGDISIKLSN